MKHIDPLELDRMKSLGTDPVSRAKRSRTVSKLSQQYPGATVQRSAHGAGSYSVQFFRDGKLIADHKL